jgi:hypothetical protein
MPVNRDQGWSYSHALYITNTYQLDHEGSERAVIDVENTRYDLQLGYSQQLWHFNINLSLVDNQPGHLDSTIEDWHDFWGLPQGGRDRAVNDRLQLSYEKDGETIFRTSQSGNGLADIQLSAGYSLDENSRIWMALELPSNSNNELISNDRIDLAFWLSTQHPLSENNLGYASIGTTLIGNGGVFKDRLNEAVLFAQGGTVYHYSETLQFLLQADYHSPIVQNSDLHALGHSLQAQFALRLPRLIGNHWLEVFFSEDIWPGHAPDITFAIRLSTSGQPSSNQAPKY